MSKYDDLNRLEDLKQRGVISEEEFQSEKSKVLASDQSSNATPKGDSMLGLKNNDYIMLMHLSQFAGFILPLLGFVAPVALWLMNAKNDPEIDRHGRNITNFMISMVIYSMVAGLLCLAIIGIPILIALAVLWVIFVIRAAIKANRGEYWKYPLSITFFS